jgi:glutaredoxin-related protein
MFSIQTTVIVKENGIDLEKDHVNLLEAVEKLFLYLRDMDQRFDSSQDYQRPGIGAKCCQRNCVEGAVSSAATCLHTPICPLT